MALRLVSAVLAVAAALPAAANLPDDAEPTVHPVHCVAVFELMSRAAPRWMTQIDVQIARRSWQIEAGQSALRTNADYGAQINHELEALNAGAEMQRRELTVLASQCVADAPL